MKLSPAQAELIRAMQGGASLEHEVTGDWYLDGRYQAIGATAKALIIRNLIEVTGGDFYGRQAVTLTEAGRSWK